jgi:TPR repeat protein
MRPREPPPPWHAKTPRGAFEGDVAIKELRQRMALAPDLPPSPPLRRDRGAAPGMVLRLAGLVTLAAIAAYGFVWISTPRPQAADSASSGFQDPAAAGEESSLSPAILRPPVSPSDAEQGASGALEEAFPTELPRRPDPWLLPDRRGDGARSAVSPTTGTAVPLPAAGLQRPAAPGPSTLGPSTLGTSVASPGPEREEVAALIARGQTYLANGDVASARLVFRRAAKIGDAQAALALGGTFDPIVLRSLGVIGVAADAAQARNWYEKAAELGSLEAPHRIDQLAQRTR